MMKNTMPAVWARRKTLRVDEWSSAKHGPHPTAAALKARRNFKQLGEREGVLIVLFRLPDGILICSCPLMRRRV